MATLIGPSGKPSEAQPNAGWVALGGVGIAFVAVGLVDLVLAWTPPRFGNADWEFGTVTAMFNNLPVPAMGLGLLFASASARRATRVTRAVGVIATVIAIWCLVGALLYGLTLPLALGSITEPGPRQALVTSSVKTAVQIVLYAGYFLWLARLSWTWDR